MEQILALLKSATPQVLLGFFLGSSFLLFMPEEWLSILALTEILENNKTLIGITFVFSGSLTTAYLLFYLKDKFPAFYNSLNLRYSIRKKVYSLTPLERAYLLAYIQNEQPTQYFGCEDGVSGGLAASGVIFSSASIGNHTDGFAYNLHAYARKLLSEQSTLLDGAEGSVETARQRRMGFM